MDSSSPFGTSPLPLTNKKAPDIDFRCDWCGMLASQDPKSGMRGCWMRVIDGEMVAKFCHPSMAHRHICRKCSKKLRAYREVIGG